MKIFSFLFFIAFATMATTSCQPPKPGSYDAPNRGYEGELSEEDLTQRVDSSVEKAIMKKDTSKKTEHHL